MRRFLIRAMAALALWACAGTALADAYVLEPKRGRSGPVRETRDAGDADWAFTVGGGLGASGDLFQVKGAVTGDWTAPIDGEVFQARRFSVTLDENVLVGFGFSRRVTRLGWLRLDFSWTELEATALANDSQFVELVPYDALTMIRVGVAWEQRLVDEAWAPFVVLGVSHLDVEATADFLDQSGLAPTIGLGLDYDLSGPWRLRCELTDTLVQLESSGVTAGDWPGDAVYTEVGPQHLIALTLGMAVLF